MPQLLNRLAVCINLIFPIVAASPTRADEPNSTAIDDSDGDRSTRGLPCRRTCEDRYKEWVEDCQKNEPPGFFRDGCIRRASALYRACLFFCKKGPRDIDDDEIEATTSECMIPSPNDI